MIICIRRIEHNLMPAGREETVDDREILRVFAESGDPVLFTGEVADAIGFSNQGTLPRLEKLLDEGYLNMKRGGRVPVWWLSDAGRAFLDDDA